MNKRAGTTCQPIQAANGIPILTFGAPIVSLYFGGAVTLHVAYKLMLNLTNSCHRDSASSAYQLKVWNEYYIQNQKDIIGLIAHPEFLQNAVFHTPYYKMYKIWQIGVILL